MSFCFMEVFKDYRENGKRTFYIFMNHFQRVLRRLLQGIIERLRTIKMSEEDAPK